MKRLICIILSLVLLVSCSSAFASAMSDKYDEALELFMQNKYREAAAILDEISIYNDASQLSMYCKSIAEGTEGNYSVAYRMLDALGGYKDSNIWSIYFKACEAQDKGEDLLAYDLFSSISLFRDSAERMQGVQTGKNSDFKKEYSIGYSSIHEGLIVVKKDDKCGYADIHGNIVLETEWKEAGPFEDGLAIVERESGLAYVINRDGRNVVGSYWRNLWRENEYFETWEFDYSDMKIIRGLIDKKGTVILEAKYDAVDVLNPSCVAVELNGKHGLYNMQGRELLRIQYEDIDSINNSLIAVQKGDKYALYNVEGKAISGFVYDYVGYGSEELVIVRSNGKAGFVDLNGNVAIEPIYDKAFSFSKEGIARVQINDKTGYIDAEGNVVIPFEYEDLSSFKDGKARAKKDGKWGIIDLSNSVLIPFEYDKIDDFTEGVAIAKKGEKFGYIDEAGNAITEFRWDAAGTISEGLAIVSDESGQYCINTEGEIAFAVSIVGIQYPLFEFRNDGVAIICQKREEKDENGRAILKYGMIDNTGNVLFAPEYDSIHMMADGIYQVRIGGFSDGKYGLVDSKGTIILEPKYNSISYFDDEGHSLVVGETTWFIIDTEGNVVF